MKCNLMLKSFLECCLGRWMVRVAALLSCLMLPAQSHAAPAVRIGPFYPEAPNGIAFIVDHKAAFLLRIGWMQHGHLQDGYHAFVADMKGYGPSAADGSYNRLTWYVGAGQVQLRWSRVEKTIVGQLESSKPLRIALETTPSWPEFPVRYSLTRHGIEGIGMRDGQTVAHWKLLTTLTPVKEISVLTHAALTENIQRGTSSSVRKGTYAALVFNLTPGTSLYFTAGTAALGKVKQAGQIITRACRRYKATRVSAHGTWGNFLKPINRD